MIERSGTRPPLPWLPQGEAELGREAINVLVDLCYAHKDEMIVILAGYKNEMDALFAANAGLASRFPHKVHSAGVGERGVGGTPKKQGRGALGVSRLALGRDGDCVGGTMSMPSTKPSSFLRSSPSSTIQSTNSSRLLS